MKDLRFKVQAKLCLIFCSIIVDVHCYEFFELISAGRGQPSSSGALLPPRWSQTSPPLPTDTKGKP